MKNSQAENCLKRLKDYFGSKDNSILAPVSYPDSIEYASEEWISYVFYSCLLDYGMRSKIYHKNLIATYDQHAEIFDSKFIMTNMEPSVLLEIMKSSIHPRYPNIAIQKWIKLSTYLSKYDNLENTISKFDSFSELEKLVYDSKCYGQKTGGLLLRELKDAGICQAKDDMESIPLDRHDIEISYLNGLIDTTKPSSKDLKELSSIWIQAGKKLHMTPSEVDKYLWELGTRHCVKKLCDTCPLNDICQKKG